MDLTLKDMGKVGGYQTTTHSAKALCIRHGLTQNSAWKSNYMLINVQFEIYYPFYILQWMQSRVPVGIKVNPC